VEGTFKLVFQTLAGLAVAFNILVMMVSVPFIINHYDTPGIREQRTIELYVTIHLFLSGIFVGYIFVEGFNKRQIFYFSSTFSIIGIALILFGSIVQVPYHEYNEIRVDYSRNITPYVARHDNGSSKQISIPPNSSVMYVWDDNGKENISIVQIDIGTTGLVFYAVSELEWGRDPLTGQSKQIIRRILFDGGFNGDAPSLDWYTRFWTTPEAMWSDKGLEFENPNDHEITVSFRITEFLKVNDQVREEYYDTLLDQSYAYGGLVLLGVSVVLTTLFPMKSKSNTNPKNP